VPANLVSLILRQLEDQLQELTDETNTVYCVDKQGGQTLVYIERFDNMKKRTMTPAHYVTIKKQRSSGRTGYARISLHSIQDTLIDLYSLEDIVEQYQRHNRKITPPKALKSTA